MEHAILIVFLLALQKRGSVVYKSKSSIQENTRFLVSLQVPPFLRFAVNNKSLYSLGSFESMGGHSIQE